LDCEKFLLLGYARVVVAELVEVYNKGFGDREVKGRMVACGGVCVYSGGGGTGSLIWGISARRALWSLSFVRNVVEVVGGSWGASDGKRISQWSSGELVGMQVGVCGSPTCVSSVAFKRSSRVCRSSRDGVKGWLAGPRREVPECWGDQLLVGCGASVGCPGVFGFLVWFGVVGGRPRWRIFLEPVLGVGRVMARYG
jgi:hypothetical protein